MESEHLNVFAEGRLQGRTTTASCGPPGLAEPAMILTSLPGTIVAAEGAAQMGEWRRKLHSVH